ncbi:ATPase associated with various cellular activities family protein [Mycobacterium xenopi 3993]|nr:ATPase associated with various cellular activities family protein [Mycobacterium xenopi 3993]
MIKRAMGGVLFIDEAYYLYKVENERDYGSEAIEILLQVMENNRDDLVVILAGYADKMDTFFSANPGCRAGLHTTSRSRTTHSTSLRRSRC